MTENNLHVALLQIHIEAGDPEANIVNVMKKLKEAVAATIKPDVIVLPEMWNTGYALDRISDLADREGERTKSLLSSFSREHQIHIIAGSVADKSGGQVRNTTYVFDKNGEVSATYSKIHLFRLMEEEKHLTAGEQLGAFFLEDVPVGMLICYDIRFPELTRKLALGGAKVLFVPAQWPKPRLHHWRSLLIARAIENQMYVVACNRMGTSDGAEFFGHSLIIDPWGEIIAEADEDETIVTAKLDLQLVDEVRQRIPVFADRRPQHY